MNISLAWLNSYLDPGNVTAEEADLALTEAGFPLESVTDLPGGDKLLDVEVTSNRGDCLSHIGCAREIAASGSLKTSRRLVIPEVDAGTRGPSVSESITLENRTPEQCPLFTARLIRGVKIGPSPEWLVKALESIGQRSINNVVDVTNFITFELGNPCHVFDLKKMAGGRVIVRFAQKGEKVKTLYEGEHTLRETDLVVADGDRPQSVAGVIGGFDSQVDESTTDVIFEMATWDPATIRRSGRRMNISTDARYRFERGVHPGTIEAAAERAVALICQVSSGVLADGALSEGAPIPAAPVVDLRPSRCDEVIGIDTPPERVIELLEALEIRTERAGDDLIRCTIPAHRLDLTREIDLVEEVARTRGLADVPIREQLSVRVQPPQDAERAVREIGSVLTGLGFYETVTISFVAPDVAARFLANGLEPVAVDDDRRKAEPVLRPSVLPSLMQCRRSNQDAGVSRDGGVRLFETSATFAQRGSESVERPVLAMLMDVPGDGTNRSTDDKQHGLRVMRGAIDAVVRALYGPQARVTVEPSKPDAGAWDSNAFGRVLVDGSEIGVVGLLGADAQKHHDLNVPVIGAELDLRTLCAAFPPKTSASPLPAFPGIERDLSLVVNEEVAWARVEALVSSCEPELLAHCRFVGTYRGKQVGAGKKSLTLRLGFRDPTRTLRHEEVDPQVEAVVEAAKSELGAEIRG